MNETRSPEAHNPGGKIKLKLPHFIRGTATFSPCGKYRHLLTRDWQAPLWQDRRYVLWIGMNPSTGDADHDDPTIRREIYFTMRLGYPRLIMANIMDYRATNPKTLLASGNPRSPQNIPHIIEAAKAATLIVAAWGSLPAALAGYTKAVEDALHAIYPAPPIACLGFTKGRRPETSALCPRHCAAHRLSMRCPVRHLLRGSGRRSNKGSA